MADSRFDALEKQSPPDFTQMIEAAKPFVSSQEVAGLETSLTEAVKNKDHPAIMNFLARVFATVKKVVF